MKKRISALVLSSCLLAGCAGQGAAATGETAAPSQAVPTAAPQSLTVNGLLDTSAAVGALELYAQAQNVTLQNSFETETADLVILDAPPQDDGTWKNLAENGLLAAAAQRAGLDTESTVTALPVGQSLYAYWADNRVLTELLQSDAALDDLRAATWEEWFDFVTAVTHWCAEPGAVQVTLNGNVYTLPAERRETLANLNGVFAAQEPEVSGNSGDGGVAENTPALYTTALLAAGEPLTEENLTGPLNALEQELRLEDANSAWQAGIADLWTSKYLFQQGNALFYRGYLADLISDSGAALSSAQKDALVWLPIKNNLTEADIANQRFNLAGLSPYEVGPTGRICHTLCPASARKSTKSLAAWPMEPMPYPPGRLETGIRIPLQRFFIFSLLLKTFCIPQSPSRVRLFFRYTPGHQLSSASALSAPRAAITALRQAAAASSSHRPSRRVMPSAS